MLLCLRARGLRARCSVVVRVAKKKLAVIKELGVSSRVDGCSLGFFCNEAASIVFRHVILEENEMPGCVSMG